VFIFNWILSRVLTLPPSPVPNLKTTLLLGLVTSPVPSCHLQNSSAPRSPRRPNLSFSRCNLIIFSFNCPALCCFPAPRLTVSAMATCCLFQGWGGSSTQPLGTQPAL